jgi:macrodomain Ter protein organizer (MatP/YcbG family)
MSKTVIKPFLIIGVLACIRVLGQSAPAAKPTATPNAQPTIMVIPFTPSGQDLRQNFESNELLRVAIAKVKDAFDQRGVNTIDFRAKLKQMNNAEALQSEQKKSIKDDVIAISGADVYVEIEANANYSSSGNSVNVIMTAYDAFSGESYANKVSNSPKFYTTNYEKLVEKAVELEVPNLLSTIQEKFADIQQNGRTITVKVGIGEKSKFKLDMEVDKEGNLLSDIIEDFIKDNSYKNKYHLQGISDNRINFDLVKVPLKDDLGNNFRLSKFASDFRKFLRAKEITCSQVIVGNSLI